MDISKLPSWLQLSPRHFFGLALATGIFVFSPSSIVEMLGLAKFLEEYRGWIGALFVFSLACWLAQGLAPLGLWIYKQVNDLLLMRARKNALKHLSPEEQSILSRYFEANSKTITLDITSGLHAALESQKVIYRASSLSRGFTNFDYNIQPWAWRYLKDHPELIKRFTN